MVAIDAQLQAETSIGGTVNLQAADAGELKVLESTGLVPKIFDHVALVYAAGVLTTATFKTGGAGGATVATVTLEYSAGVLSTVTRT